MSPTNTKPLVSVLPQSHVGRDTRQPQKTYETFVFHLAVTPRPLILPKWVPRCCWLNPYLGTGPNHFVDEDYRFSLCYEWLIKLEVAVLDTFYIHQLSLTGCIRVVNSSGTISENWKWEERHIPPSIVSMIWYLQAPSKCCPRAVSTIWYHSNSLR